MKKLSLFSALGVSTLTLGAILASGLSTAEETEKSVDIEPPLQNKAWSLPSYLPHKAAHPAHLQKLYFLNSLIRMMF